MSFGSLPELRWRKIPGTETSSKSASFRGLIRISDIICGEQEQGDGDAEAGVTDLLADIQHYCDSENLDFQELLKRATMHHDAEVDEEKA